MVKMSKACHHEVVNKGRKLISRTNVRLENGDQALYQRLSMEKYSVWTVVYFL